MNIFKSCRFSLTKKEREPTQNIGSRSSSNFKSALASAPAKKNSAPTSKSVTVLLLGLTVSHFFLVSRNTKLYETGHCFAEFRSFRETGKNMKIQKSVSSCFAKLKKHFVS